eukprot:TRINITY_DN407_c0_g6_i1.p1 TRINITY_DN407_c0_g6~~TRINITY_DN407_c0_g6_i1.p1  ORF type:complete len:386 (-),score=63.53 TRINITY_DN407_c0_g6_i1:836-1993(-)
MDQIVKEQYNIWKENSPLLYDLVMTHRLDWPSLTVQWFNSIDESTAEQGYNKQQLLLGTQTSGQEQDLLIIADVNIPTEETEGKTKLVQGNTMGTVDVKKEFKHAGGDVNRARINPVNHSLIATKTPQSEVLIFETNQESGSGHVLKLTGHDKIEGYGIDWNSMNGELIASGSYDKKVCVWKVNLEADQTQPFVTYSKHEGFVEGVSWKINDENVFGSCGDDKKVILYDLRSEQVASQEEPFHEAEVNAISFNPNNDREFATCGSDRLVAIFDMRRMEKPQHYMCCHDDACIQLQWNPNNAAWLASGGEDRKILLYNLSKIGEEQSPEDAMDGPPELVFTHGGHLGKVIDFGWNPKSNALMMCSVAEENLVQIWQPAKEMFSDEE